MQPTVQAEQTGESIESSLAGGVSEDRTAEELADDAALASEIQLLQAEIGIGCNALMFNMQIDGTCSLRVMCCLFIHNSTHPD